MVSHGPVDERNRGVYGGLTNYMSLQPHVMFGVKMGEWMGKGGVSKVSRNLESQLLMKLLPFFAFSFSESELTHCRFLNGHETQLLGSGKPRRKLMAKSTSIRP